MVETGSVWTRADLKHGDDWTVWAIWDDGDIILESSGHAYRRKIGPNELLRWYRRVALEKPEKPI